MNKLSLPISPFLDNSTNWWIDNKPENKQYEGKIRYALYEEWMKKQGVNINSGLSDKLTIDFVDEESMVIFILRWGN